MRRRIIWRFGDSPPIFGHLVAAVEGDGELRVVVGFPVSSVDVSFSKVYNRYLLDTLGYDYTIHAFAPEVYVSTIDDDGFTICYKNIPESLDVNYFVM
jgi:hypothetical protein